MNDITVLLTAGGAPFMPGMARCLKKNGERNIKIIAVDMCNDRTIEQLVDKFYTVPPASDPNYMTQILKVCEIEHVDVVLPFMSRELLDFHAHIQDFEERKVKVSLSGTDSIKISNNKLELYNFLKNNRLMVPDFYPIYKMQDLDGALEYFRYPERAICIKAAESSGSRGIRIIDPQKSRFDILFNEKPNSFFTSLVELKEILAEKAEIPTMLAMEVLPGNEYSVDVLADQGNVLYMAGRESTIVTASIQQDAVIKKDDEAYEISRKIIRMLRLDGTVNFDFKYDENKRPVLMEINPRISATMSVQSVAGINFPYLRIKQLIGEPLPDLRIQYGIHMKRRYFEMYVDKNGEAVYL